MLTFFYNTIIFVFTLLYFPYLLVKGKWHEGMPLRLGWQPVEDVVPRLEKPRIWIHAVSVGETLAVSSLIRRLKERFPEYALVVTTVTPTGYRVAEQQLPDDVVVLYAPVDFSWIVRRFVDVIQPILYITAETEIWPNLFSQLKRRGIPVVIVNGRISERAFRRYILVKFFLKTVLSAVKCFGMQTQSDAQRIIDLGAEKESVNVVGNVKFDDLPEPGGKKPADWGYAADQALWVGGSTHPGEEEVLLRQYQKLRAEFPLLRLILAPRHVERAGDVVRSVTAAGLKPVYFSRLPQERGLLKSSDSVLVIDEIGKLRQIYEIASIVFVGKSLCGQGGQNIIEPAFYSKPVIVGPHMENFAKIFEVFEHADAVIQVADEKSLYEKVRHLLSHPSETRQMGETARRVVDLNRGATERTLRLFEPILPQASRINSY
jgi:3-deoxy-D-manno-octulosonic-acid transferase